MRMIHHILFLIPVFIFSISIFADPKRDAYDLPQVVAVENKMFNPLGDITLNVGILPLDAYYKAITLGLSYSKYYQSYWSWEIINLNVAFTQDTGLKKDLIEYFSVSPTGILDHVKYYLTSNLIYTPVYSKNLFFGDTVVHGDMSLLFGGGMVAFSTGETSPMLGGGGHIRFYKNETFSFKLGSRLYYHMAPSKSSNLILSIDFGFSFDFPGEAKNANSL